MSKKKGFSIRIFLPDGSPDGLRIVEKSNWSGKGLFCPRSLLPEVKSRDEFSKTGVYCLIGPAEDSDDEMIYVGEGDPVRRRLEQHFSQKDFWSTLFFFISKDENLNKAHIKYLEAKLIQLAKEAKRCKLDNSNQPELPNLSEMDIADVEGFLDEMLLCLPVFGILVFEKPKKKKSQKDLLYIKAKGIEAKGHESTQGFIVLEGSQAVVDEVASIHNSMVQLRKNLLSRGVLNKENNMYIFVQDYEFNSPSLAAAVVQGRNANGRLDWKTKEGRTLKEIQAEKK